MEAVWHCVRGQHGQTNSLPYSASVEWLHSAADNHAFILKLQFWSFAGLWMLLVSHLLTRLSGQVLELAAGAVSLFVCHYFYIRLCLLPCNLTITIWEWHVLSSFVWFEWTHELVSVLSNTVQDFPTLKRPHLILHHTKKRIFVSLRWYYLLYNHNSIENSNT